MRFIIKKHKVTIEVEILTNAADETLIKLIEEKFDLLWRDDFLLPAWHLKVTSTTLGEVEETR